MGHRDSKISDDLVASRKDAHLGLCLQQPVEIRAPRVGLGGFMLEYDALPEVDLDEVDLSTTLLGHRLNAPLVVGAMTGGTEQARELNQRLARAAGRVGVAMALGSQRAMIEHPALIPTYAVREAAPDLPLLLGNLGAVQLKRGITAEQINAALAAVSADALLLHLNPLQEAIQPEGDTCFAGLMTTLAAVIPQIPLPTLIKEVGAGLSARTAGKLACLPIAGVEVAGVGGTSWALVESLRAPAGSIQAEAGRRLAGLGVPTALSVQLCRQQLGERVVIASGGVRTGLDVAVALALGADAAAVARPLLQAAAISEEAVVRELQILIFELRVICFCTGARTPAELRDRGVFPAGRWAVQQEAAGAKKISAGPHKIAACADAGHGSASLPLDLHPGLQAKEPVR